MRRKKTPNLAKLLEPYANKWVALSRDQKRVLASGDSLKKVATKAGARAVLMKVFPRDSLYAPLGV